MKIGIFAKTFQRSSVQEVCEAVKSYHFELAQFNLACTGLPAMPDHIPEKVVAEIKQARKSADLVFCGISGTYNMCHPDPKVRNDGLKRLEVLAKNSKAIGSDLITLCTGTRDPDDQWKFHPDNHSRETWKILSNSMEQALQIAAQYSINLGIEPELGNVVSSAAKAHTLLREMGSKRLKVILDPGNLFEIATVHTIQDLIDEAIDLLAPAIIMAHAKDRDGKGDFAPPGKGIIPFEYLIRQLRAAGLDPPIVAHGFPEVDAGPVFDYLTTVVV